MRSVLTVPPGAGRAKRTIDHGRLGHPGRLAEGLSERRHPAQGHHDQGLSGAHQPVPRHPAEDHQPVALVQLPEPRLLLLAARRGPRPPRHPLGRDHGRPRRRASFTPRRCPNSTTRSPRRLPPPDDKSVPARHPGLFRRRRGPPLRPLRPPAVRLVPLPGARGDASRTAIGRRSSGSPRFRSPSSTPGRTRLLPRGAPQPHPARVALEEGSRRAALFLRRPLRSQRGDAAVGPGDAEALVADRREAWASRSSRSPAATSRGSPNSTRCSSARRPRSTITPTALPAAPCRRACRSSTTRSR